MADGFVVRRGGANRFYEGTVELAINTKTATIPIGFEPKAVFLYKAEGNATNLVVNSLFVAFNGSDAEGCCYRNTTANASQLITPFSDIATVVKTNDGVNITLLGSYMFNGTYTVLATA